MTGEEFRAQAAEILRQYTIGLVRVDREHLDEVMPTSLGSGTLVNFGGVRGLLTASHVWAAVAKEIEVGVLRFRNGLPEYVAVSTSEMAALQLGGEDAGPQGPDLAFIRLPIDLEETLAATNVFFTPETHGKAMLATGYVRPDVQARLVTGVLAERTKRLPQVGALYATQFQGFVAGGEIVERHENATGFDYFEFSPQPSPEQQPIESFGGLSGGGVWQLFDMPPPLHRNLVGVVYRQSAQDTSGERLLICNGPKSVYIVLADKVAERWSGALRLDSERDVD